MSARYQYRFRHAPRVREVTLEKPSVLEFKRYIRRKHKLDSSREWRLLILDKYTGKRYDNDNKRFLEGKELELLLLPGHERDAVFKDAALVNEPQTEAERLKAVLETPTMPTQEGEDAEVPPPNYCCHRCNKHGHFIKQCPTRGDPAFNVKLPKAPTGIPRSYLKPAPPGQIDGVFITEEGEEVIVVYPDNKFS